MMMHQLTAMLDDLDFIRVPVKSTVKQHPSIPCFAYSCAGRE